MADNSSNKIEKPFNGKYFPCPMLSKQVTINAELTELAHVLAEHKHDIWAYHRILEGWTYGKERNDELKQTPCLVPYDDLPEGEKEYDMRDSLETIKFIISLGFNISKD